MCDLLVDHYPPQGPATRPSPRRDDPPDIELGNSELGNSRAWACSGELTLVTLDGFGGCRFGPLRHSFPRPRFSLSRRFCQLRQPSSLASKAGRTGPTGRRELMRKNAGWPAITTLVLFRSSDLPFSGKGRAATIRPRRPIPCDDQSIVT